MLNNIKSKILDLKDLEPIINDERFKNKKSICLSNGSFDLLHSGHVTMLCEAKSYGDILVMALNTDNSIGRYKDSKRPIIPLHERMVMVAALSFVDYVTWFDDVTPMNVINKLKPNFIIKGENTQSTIPVEERMLAEKHGAQFVYIPMVGRVSTTNIIETIKFRYHT